MNCCKIMDPNKRNAKFICIILLSPLTADDCHYLGRCIWMALLIFRLFDVLSMAEQQQCVDGGGMEFCNDADNGNGM